MKKYDWMNNKVFLIILLIICIGMIGERIAEYIFGA